jgi:imidazolonepropionase
VFSLPVVIALGVRLYGLTALEALAGTTINSAWTLGLQADRGSIEVGKRADLLVLDGPVEQIAYRFGHNPVLAAFVAGEPVFVRDDARARCQGL